MENNSASPNSPALATSSHRKFPVGASVLAALTGIPVLIVGGVVGGFVVSALHGGHFNPRHITIVDGLTIQLFAYLALIPYLLWAMTKLWRVSLRDLGFRVPGGREIGIALLGALGMILIVQGLAQIIQSVLHTQHEQQAVQLLKAVRSPGVLAFFAIFAIFIAPFVEELTFRVFIFGGAARVAPVWAAALLSGALFGAAHADPIAFVPLAIGGMLLCIVYYRTRNAWMSMISHAIFNGTTILALLLAQRAGIH